MGAARMAVKPIPDHDPEPSSYGPPVALDAVGALFEHSAGEVQKHQQLTGLSVFLAKLEQAPWVTAAHVKAAVSLMVETTGEDAEAVDAPLMRERMRVAHSGSRRVRPLFAVLAAMFFAGSGAAIWLVRAPPSLKPASAPSTVDIASELPANPTSLALQAPPPSSTPAAAPPAVSPPAAIAARPAILPPPAISPIPPFLTGDVAPEPQANPASLPSPAAQPSSPAAEISAAAPSAAPPPAATAALRPITVPPFAVSPVPPSLTSDVAPKLPANPSVPFLLPRVPFSGTDDTAAISPPADATVTTASPPPAALPLPPSLTVDVVPGRPANSAFEPSPSAQAPIPATTTPSASSVLPSLKPALAGRFPLSLHLQTPTAEPHLQQREAEHRRPERPQRIHLEPEREIDLPQPSDLPRAPAPSSQDAYRAMVDELHRVAIAPEHPPEPPSEHFVGRYIMGPDGHRVFIATP